MLKRMMGAVQFQPRITNPFAPPCKKKSVRKRIVTDFESICGKEKPAFCTEGGLEEWQTRKD